MKKNIKKIISVIATTIAVSTMLVGCGGSGENASSKGENTITYSIWDKIQEPGMRAIADAFEEKNPGIKVNVEVTPWDQYWTKLEAAASGGSLPDVFWMHAKEFTKYAKGNALLDLTEEIKGDVDLSKYPEGLVELYSLDNKNYAVPKDFDTVGLWYNKTLFDQAGVSYPDETWTWDTLLEASKKLTNKEAGVYGFGAPLNEHEGYYDFIYQNGGEVLIDNKTKSGYHMPETVEAMQWYVDLSLKEEVSPKQDQFAENSPAALFQSGKIAMGLFGSWMTAEFASNEYTAENCDVAVLPKGKERASIYNGLGNSVSASSKNKDAAVKFVEFLGSEEAQKIQADKGSAISAYEGTADTWINAAPKFNLQAYIDMLDYSKIKPYTTHAETAKWEKLQNDILKRAFAGEISVTDACAQLATEVDKVLNEK